MRIRVLCPDGHPVELDESRLGTVVACPRCLVPFHAEVDGDDADYARAEKGRSRPARDDDDDDEDDDDEDDRPAKKKAQAKPVKKKKPVDDEEDEDDEDGDEEDDDEPTGPLTKKQRNLQMVSLGLSLIMWAVICFALLPLVSVIQGMLVAFALIAGAPWLLYVTLGFSGASMLAINVLMLIGVSFGFWMPRSAEVKGAIFGNMLFGALVLVFALLGTLGITGVLLGDAQVALRFSYLCFGLMALCELLFFMTTMGYLKKIASFFRDILLASEPVNLLIEFTIWYVVPQIIDRALSEWTNQYRNLDAISSIAVGLFALFSLFAFFRSYFVLLRWIRCVSAIRDLVDRAIKAM
jgi:hypothetical protein